MRKMSEGDPCWCGSGRPYGQCHLEQDEKLRKYRSQGYVIPSRSLVKKREHIEGIRKSGRITTRILDMVGERIKAGVSTEEINTWVHEYTLREGAIPAPLNYHGFPKSVCTSINNVICHGIPDKDTIVKDGDIINVDVTTILDGYYADASRMFIIGNAPENARQLVKVTKECLELAVQQVKPYNSINAIGRVIERHAKNHGYSVVRDLGGHGIGLQFHEHLFIDHYEKNAKGVLMVPGMVFTIEPMINEGTYHCTFSNDGWTVVTRDGKLSAQWEYTMVVTETGVEILAQ